MSEIKINVLHVVDKLSLGGATKHGVTQLFSWWFPLFDKRRYNVTLCSLKGRDKAGEHLENLGVNVTYLNRAKIDPRTLLDLLQLVKARDVHVLHLHGYGATTFGRVCSLLTGTPAIVHEHMTDMNIPIYQQAVDWVLGKVTRNAIAVSQSVKEFMVNKRGVPEHTVKVIYNGAPLSLFQKTKEPAPTEWEDHNPQDVKKNQPPVIAIVGRLHAIKGHTYFLQAAEQVLRIRKDARFWVVGDGELMQDLQSQARELGIEEQVQFTGYTDNVPGLLQQVEIKVIASLSEGIPLTLFEAMAAGIPVVSTRVGGIPEILKDGKTGFLVPSRDPEALAEMILQLLNDRQLRAAMSEEAVRQVQDYDVANTVSQFEIIYEQLAGALVGQAQKTVLYS